MSLFIKECGHLLKSLIYLVFIAVVVIFYITQLGNYAGDDIKQAKSNTEYSYQNPLMKPPPNAESYGTKQAEIPEQVMPNAIVSLLSEYQQNNFITYPIGFYKNIKLNEKEQLVIADIIKELTGESIDVLLKKLAVYNESRTQAYLNGAPDPTTEGIINVVVDYDTFKERLTQIDKVLGGGSKYSKDWLASYASIPITYEEKLAEYNSFISEDRILGAYARLFSDYMGITISLFSIFVPVSFLMRDRRYRINELLSCHKKSSLSIVISRYCAVVVMMILPFFLLSIRPTVQLVTYGIQSSTAVDPLAFVKYIITWLVPTLMTTTAVGFIFTVLTDTPIAIIIQLAWSFIFDLMDISRLHGGNYSTELTIRHNTLGNLQAVKDGITALTINRVSYTLISLLIIALTAYLYEQKRRGRIDIISGIQKIYRHIKGTD